MKEVLECTSCGKVFSTQETLKKHAHRVHKTRKVMKEDSGLFNL